MPAPKLPPQTLELMAQRFRTMGEPMRLQLLHSLESGEKNVSELIQAVGSTQANVSKHLALLVQAGLVGRRREGTHVYYRIDDPIIFDICRLVCQGLLEQQQRTTKALRRSWK